MMLVYIYNGRTSYRQPVLIIDHYLHSVPEADVLFTNEYEKVLNYAQELVNKSTQ